MRDLKWHELITNCNCAQIDGSVHDSSNSIANALELLQSCTKPSICYQQCGMSLQWRHNGHDGVSNHQLHQCLLNPLFGRRSKKTSKLRVTGLCVGNSPGTGEFPAQMASNVEKKTSSCVVPTVGVNSIISTPTPTPELSTPTPTPANLQNINFNSNSGGFNSNSNSGKSPEYQLQLQLQLRRFQLQLQFQLRQIFRISTPTPEISTPIPTPTVEFQIQPQLHFKSNQSCSTKLQLPNYNVKHCMN